MWVEGKDGVKNLAWSVIYSNVQNGIKKTQKNSMEATKYADGKILASDLQL